MQGAPGDKLKDRGSNFFKTSSGRGLPTNPCSHDTNGLPSAALRAYLKPQWPKRPWEKNRGGGGGAGDLPASGGSASSWWSHLRYPGISSDSLERYVEAEKQPRSWVYQSSFWRLEERETRQDSLETGLVFSVCQELEMAKHCSLIGSLVVVDRSLRCFLLFRRAPWCAYPKQMSAIGPSDPEILVDVPEDSFDLSSFWLWQGYLFLGQRQFASSRQAPFMVVGKT
ncbi:hypothetical protein C8J56DRAFT_903300 [Mycena floridula]|nr:hypothetical protein C8J56DRAFT_903300 [Mycena floridula]